MDIGSLGMDVRTFMEDDYVAVKFWYKNKSNYPGLYKNCCRIFATPVSS